MQESWLYNPTTSAELSISSIVFPLIFVSLPLSLFWFSQFYTNLRYGSTRDVAAEGRAKLLYDLFDQIYEARVFSESIYSQTIIHKTTFMTHLGY